MRMVPLRTMSSIVLSNALLPVLLVVFSATVFCTAHAADTAARTVTTSLQPVPAELTVAQQLTELLERESNQLRRWNADLAAATDLSRILDLQRQIQNLKLQTEIDMLELQRQQLSQDTTTEQREQLDTAIESLRRLLPSENGNDPTHPVIDGPK